MSELFDRLPRRLMRAMIRGDVHGAELQVLLDAWTQSLGWGAGRPTTLDWCGPTQVSKRTGVSMRQVQRALASLVDRGLLVVAQQARGTRPHEYRVCLDRLPTYDSYDKRGVGDVATDVVGDVAADVVGHENKDENKDEDQQQQPRARGWSLAERGPQPPRVETPAYDGDVSAAVERVCRAMTRPDQQGVVRRPTAMQEQHVAMAMLEVGVERVEAIARLCAAEAWGIGGLLRCFDADGRELPDKLPGAKREAAGGKQARSDEPEWARIKRERQEATERYDEIWRQVDARPDRMPTEDEEAELERLAAPMRRFA